MAVFILLELELELDELLELELELDDETELG